LILSKYVDDTFGIADLYTEDLAVLKLSALANIAWRVDVGNIVTVVCNSLLLALTPLVANENKSTELTM